MVTVVVLKRMDYHRQSHFRNIAVAASFRVGGFFLGVGASTIDSSPVCPFLPPLFLEKSGDQLARTNPTSVGQDQSTVAQRAVDERSLTSCV